MIISYLSNAKKYKKQLLSFLLSLAICINFSQLVTCNINAAEMNTTTSTYGDINQDGKINTIDLVLLKGFIVKTKSIDNFDEKYADLDGDGTIKTVDIVLLKQYLLGEIIIFPIQKTIDTDGDGLTDYIEVTTTHTDPKRSDSDGDSLSDYDEVYITGTDPNLLDTNKNNIADGDEDIDNDGLSNLKEIELGTNPLVADSDFDGLSDFEEVNNYHTNPNKADSDDDRICDGDEIKVSLDPNVAQTNGCADNEYVFEQKIDTGDAFFGNLNNDFYNISIDLTAAGYAQSALSVSESKYTNTIANNAIIGKPLDFSYDENLSFKNMRITFDLSKYASLENLENYMIFEYNEDVNEIFPLETNYDIKNNTISCNINQLGTFCVVNINTWALMYGIDEYSDASSLQNVESIKLNANNSNEVIDNAEVVFLVDASNWLNYNDNQYCTTVKNSILNSGNQLFNMSNNLKITIYEYYDITKGVYLQCNGQQYATNYEELQQMVNNISAMSTSDKNSFIAPLNILFDKEGYSIFNTNSRFVFDYIGSSYVYSTYHVNSTGTLDINSVLNSNKNNLETNNINLSIIACAANSDNLYTSTASKVQTFCENIKNNPGVYLKLSDTTAQDIFNHVYHYSTKEYKGVTSCGGTLALKHMLCNDPNACADSDGDGINDYYEVNFGSKYWTPEFDEDGSLIFPKYFDIFNNIYKMNKNIGGYNKLKSRLLQLYPNQAVNFFNNQKVLPTLSSLNKVDTDDDYYKDTIDKQPNSYDYTVIDDCDINDTGSIDGVLPIVPDDRYTNGTLQTTQIGMGSCNKNEYVFERLGNGQYCEFEITPENNSDYAITLTGAEILNADIFISPVRKIIFGNYSDKIEYAEEPVYSGNTATFDYALEEGVTYTICITVDTLNPYQVKISQNNWVYASMGGEKNYINPKADGIILHQTYFTATEVYDIVKEQFSDEWGGLNHMTATLKQILESSDFEKITNDKVVNLFLNGLKYGDENKETAKKIFDDFMTTSGNTASITGAIVYLLDSSEKYISGISTVVGGITASYSVGYSLYLEGKRNQLLTSLVDGKYNIYIGYSQLWSQNIAINNYYNWNEQNYISRYYKYSTNGNITFKTVRCDVVPYTNIINKN